jgi:hypothetical protein
MASLAQLLGGVTSSTVEVDGLEPVPVRDIVGELRLTQTSVDAAETFFSCEVAIMARANGRVFFVGCAGPTYMPPTFDAFNRVMHRVMHLYGRTWTNVYLRLLPRRIEAQTVFNRAITIVEVENADEVYNSIDEETRASMRS